MWTLCDTENKCLNCTTVTEHMSRVLFFVHAFGCIVCKGMEACQVISILQGFEEAKGCSH